MKRLPRLDCKEAEIMVDLGILKRPSGWPILIHGPATVIILLGAVVTVVIPCSFLILFGFRKLAGRYSRLGVRLFEARPILWLLGQTYKVTNKDFFVGDLDNQIRKKFKLPNLPRQ